MLSTILAFALPLLSKLPGAVGDFFKGQQEIEKLKQEANRQLQLANIELSREMAKAQLEHSKEVLRATSPWFKYFTFGMWFGPYMMQVIYPPLGQQVFDNMLGMPEWYAQSCVAIMFTVWGITVSSPVISNIFQSLGSFFKARHEYKIQKASVDKKTVFESLRVLFPRGFTPEQVKVINEALDKGSE